MLFRKVEKSPNDFWQEYEEKIGEKVLARGMGKYISGWDEFDEKKLTGIWGLVINTSGGFRFNHFPQNSWIDVITRPADRDPPKEKTIFIPKENIVSSELIKETKWWKRLVNPLPPRLVIIYMDDTDNKKKLIFEAEYNVIL